MDSRYKIFITGDNLYREIELPTELMAIRIGTGKECEVRLRKEDFFEPIELRLKKNENRWYILCSDNIYINTGDIRKLITKELINGETFEICYQGSNNLVFKVDFMIDFDTGKNKYERAINLGGFKKIKVGNDYSSDIVLGSPYSKNDVVEFNCQNNRMELLILKDGYGVFHNGRKINKKTYIQNGDFFSIADYFFYYKNNKLKTQKRADMIINNLSFEDTEEYRNYPKFKRSTRIKTVIGDNEIEILDPPAKPQKPKGNIVTRLLPSMGMLIAAGAMAAMGGGTMIIFSAISGGMAIVTAILGVIEGKKDYKKGCEERIEKYNNYINNKRKEIEDYRDQEYEELEKVYISQDEEYQRLKTFSPNLFDRTPEDEDFLVVRLGNGSLNANRKIKFKKQERLEIEDDLQLMPEKLSEEYEFVEDAPITCDLKAINALGIVGFVDYRFDFLKNLVIDIASRHFYSDVKMVFVAEEKNKEKIKWLRFLPHVRADQNSGRLLVVDDESKTAIFEYLYKELTLRQQNKNYNEQIVVFFYDEYGLKTHPLSQFIENAAELGFTFIFFGNLKEDIPVGCDYVVEITGTEEARLICSNNENDTQILEYPHVDNTIAREIVRILAPVYAEEISLAGSLTKNYSMFDMLGILAVDDLNLEKRWSQSQVYNSMAAPIGISTTGTVFLDLHDKAHGPHGLVAGTTGAGKSEILQTYILAMATLFHPYEVGFVIIDFKGGGMVNQFKQLPHLMGAITNIDGKEVDRSLKSIKAELQKRQRYFAEADVNHIDKYIRKYKAGEVKEALPHLIIIVDEFAELKAEQPEFMKELISAARIGRSLGVHLILATQKPSGQVNEQIWSNSRFKLCLKVQGREDSNEVLKSPLAAEIKEPGRAYLQVGNNEIFELFQSAYSGAPERQDESNIREFTIYNLTESSKRIPIFVQKKKKAEDNVTQLDAIVEYVTDSFKSTGLEKLSDICLAPLENIIEYPKSKSKYIDNTTICTKIGIMDDPDRQYQGEYALDFTNNNVLIIGSAQSGKTNLLQNIVKGLSSTYSPEDVNIYIIDFASMVLKSFESLAHVGGVVTMSEDEKLKNLFKLLFAEIENRKARFLTLGVSSFAAYREAGKTDMPQIVLIIDNLTALKEFYFQSEDEELLNLCRESISVGISIVIANAVTQGIGYKYLSNFSSKIALFCNDTSEYGVLFEHCRMRGDDIKGRGIIEIENAYFDCQTYLSFKGEKEIDRAKAIQEYIKDINERFHHISAKRIPEIPELFTFEYVLEKYDCYLSEPNTVVAGIDYATVMPFTFDLNNLGILAISGRKDSGKHNFIRYFINMLNEIERETSEVYVIDGIKRKLKGIDELPVVANYTCLSSQATSVVFEIENELKQRYDQLVEGNFEGMLSSKTIVLVINNHDALLNISNDSSALNAFSNIKGKYKEMKVCLIVGDYENTNLSYSSPEAVKLVKESKNLMFYDDLSNLKLFDLPIGTLRQYKKPIEIGDCYYIRGNDCYKLKTPYINVNR